MNFLYEKIVLRLSVLGAFFAVLFLLFYAFFSDGTMWAPKIEHAPFVERDENGEVVKAEFIEYTLEKAHRTESEIASWASEIVSEAMSFKASEYSTQAEEIKINFTDDAFKQYQNYLVSSGIFKAIKQQNIRISTFVYEQPLLLNNMTIDEVYRWLYQIPMTVSFIPNTEKYDNETVVTRDLTLQIQIKRADLTGDRDAVQIESWQITGR